MGGTSSEHEMRGKGWTRVAKYSHQEAGKQCPNGQSQKRGSQKQSISIEHCLDGNKLKINECVRGSKGYCLIKAMVGRVMSQHDNDRH